MVLAINYKDPVILIGNNERILMRKEINRGNRIVLKVAKRFVQSCRQEFLSLKRQHGGLVQKARFSSRPNGAPIPLIHGDLQNILLLVCAQAQIQMLAVKLHADGYV